MLPELQWLTAGMPRPIIGLAGLGILASAPCFDRRLALPLLLFVVVTATFVRDAHVTPSPLWALRRFVPVTIPFLCVLAAAVLPWRRAPWLAAALAAALVAFVARPTLPLARLPLFPDQKREVARLAELLPRDAVVFFAPELADYAVHVPLWLVHDREGFVLPAWDWQRGLATGTAALGVRHPIFYVVDGDEPPAVQGLAFEPAGAAPFRFVTPKVEPDASSLPVEAVEWPLALRLYRVTAPARP
jgi:hypothetical protein